MLVRSFYHGWVSALHTKEDIERTVVAYEQAFKDMVADKAFGA